MNSDSSDSDQDTGRFKSSKLKETSGGRYISSEDNVSNYQKGMPAVERKQEHYKRHTDREREESRTSRDSKSKYSDDHKSYRPKESSRTELKSNVSSSKSDVKRRRSRSSDRNSKILNDERKKKYNTDERTRHPEDSRRNREKSKKNSHERDTQNSGHSSKSHSPHRHQKEKEKEKSDDRRSIGSNKHRSDSKNSHSDHRSDSSSKSLHENVSFGPALPPPPVETKANVIVEKQYVGPELPPGFKLNSRHSSSDDVEMEEPRQNIGPQIPKNILEQIQLQSADVDITEHSFDKVSSSEEEDDDCSFAIGPMPAGSTTLTAAQLELEKRALEIKIKKLDDAEGGSSRKLGDDREEWMIELPEIRRVADLGLGARQFRTKERPDFDDRTQWTNTPLENSKKGKEEKIDLQKAQKKLLQAARDHEQDKIANSHKKKNKRDSSLMDIHKKTLKMNVN